MGNDPDMIQDVLVKLSDVFRIRDLGKPRFFLGIEAIDKAGSLVLSQKRYMTELLRKAGMESCKPLATPIAVAAQHTTTPSAALDDPMPYRQLVGSLMYLLITRPDLGYAVNRLCQFMHAPTQENWVALKRVLRYIQGPNLLSWVSRKQRTVARSSTEAEYKALVDVAAEVTWIQSLLGELGLLPNTVPILWCDNLGATYLCPNPVFHARTKHVEVDYHFVCDKVAKGALKVNFVSTHDQLADIFTKPLSAARFSDLRCKLGVVPCPPPV
ncbi:PREDICTED: uncharacterized protein LOC109177096 [Ipomoea nil]|uniref:uncharacterized protein LOC109177096 n=1 Tax=Ipomoea nil TaxID=35883 RepID=UPI0009009A8D|nr:PREDICTED: uncharacterized protein LOC109177096 [Ipomoea nil]